ncbi:hypothetical protein FB451DRAFT_1369241 [Mycena latifolia]|nr:hypothetical protein FB451DRAFT_1369241 [Mycena latifolia]
MARATWQHCNAAGSVSGPYLYRVTRRSLDRNKTMLFIFSHGDKDSSQRRRVRARITRVTRFGILGRLNGISGTPAEQLLHALYHQAFYIRQVAQSTLNIDYRSNNVRKHLMVRPFTSLGLWAVGTFHSTATGPRSLGSKAIRDRVNQASKMTPTSSKSPGARENFLKQYVPQEAAGQYFGELGADQEHQFV